MWSVGFGDEWLDADALTIVAKVTSSGGTTTDTASVSHSDQFDPNLVNNTSSVSETPQQAGFGWSLDSVSSSSPNVGYVVTYTVTVSNAGPNLATQCVAPGCTARLVCRSLSSPGGSGTYTNSTGALERGRSARAVRRRR